MLRAASVGGMAYRAFVVDENFQISPYGDGLIYGCDLDDEEWVNLDELCLSGASQ